MVSNNVISNQIRLRRHRPGGRVASIALGVLQAVDALSTPSATHLMNRIVT
jgi:hypothetical protein